MQKKKIKKFQQKTLKNTFVLQINRFKNKNNNK